MCIRDSSWVLSHLLEPQFSENLREADRGASHAVTNFGGLEIIVLLSAALFLVCAWELTAKLAQASRIRLFYATMLVLSLIHIFNFEMLDCLEQTISIGVTHAAREIVLAAIAFHPAAIKIGRYSREYWIGLL